jgi:hypothetical protein
MMSVKTGFVWSTYKLVLQMRFCFSEVDVAVAFMSLPFTGVVVSPSVTMLLHHD